MTPDVSCMMAQAEQCWIPAGSQQGDMARAELQQAAEQACYRYALDLLEEILPNTTNPGIETVLRRLVTERDRVEQLIAGSA